MLLGDLHENTSKNPDEEESVIDELAWVTLNLTTLISHLNIIRGARRHLRAQVIALALPQALTSLLLIVAPEPIEIMCGFDYPNPEKFMLSQD